MSNTTIVSSDLVTIDSTRNVPMTTSLKVAEVFGKEHKNTIQAIELLDCSEEFRKLNFQLSSYTVPGNRRPYPMYLMTRDGFTFLAMGFNGARAAEFKERYIAEFNRMEAELRKTSVVAIPNFNNPAEAARAWADEYEKRQALEAENAAMLPKAQVYDAVVADKMMKVHEFARKLRGVNSVQTKWDLYRAGYLYKSFARTYRVYSKYRDKLFVEKIDPYSGKVDIYVTDEGKKAMTKLYNEGRLTMKGGF